MYRLEDYPHIQDNYYLGCRDQGACRKLCGSVLLISCLMRRSGQDFDAETTAQYFATLDKAVELLESSARLAGAELHIERRYFEVKTTPRANPKKGYALLNKFLTLKTAEKARDYYGSCFDAQEVAFLLVFDQQDRSFSWKQSKHSANPVDEVSVIFRGKDGFSRRTIVHELLHLFGAVDLYYPDEIRQCADRYLGESVMGFYGDRVDDLTAYLVGWKDTLSAEAYYFLKNTMWMTHEQNEHALREEWKTKFD